MLLKANAWCAGGYTTGRADVVSVLRQRARPYLFSNTLAPAVVGASLEAFDMLAGSSELRNTLQANTRFFRDAMQQVNQLPVHVCFAGAWPEDAGTGIATPKGCRRCNQSQRSLYPATRYCPAHSHGGIFLELLARMLNDETLFNALCNLPLYFLHDIHETTRLHFPRLVNDFI